MPGWRNYSPHPKRYDITLTRYKTAYPRQVEAVLPTLGLGLREALCPSLKVYSYPCRLKVKRTTKIWAGTWERPNVEEISPSVQSVSVIALCPCGPQGAIATFDAAIEVEEGIVFDGNTAVTGAGGGAYSAVSRASFNGSVFTGNKAIWGGGWYQGFSLDR